MQLSLGQRIKSERFYDTFRLLFCVGCRRPSSKHGVKLYNRFMKGLQHMIGDIYDKYTLTIKEFSEFTGISASALRFYEKEGVFLPAMRDDANYRIYLATQITLAKMVRVLSEINVSLSEIRSLNESRSPERLLKLLWENKGSILEKIGFLNDVHSVIDTYISLLSEGLSITESKVNVTRLQQQPFLLGDINDYTGTVGFVREFTRFCSAPHTPNLNMSYPIGGYWENMVQFLANPSRPTRFFSLDPKGAACRAAGLYLLGYTRGYYSQTNDLPARMKAYADEHGLIFSGPVYNIFLFDELSIDDPENYLLQVSVQVSETRRVQSHSSHLRRHF